MNTLKGLRWNPAWVSHLGCLQGCLGYLGLDLSPGWLYGGTGHAFVLNMHEEVCPSSPTAWRTMMLFELAPNLGCRLEGVFGWRNEGDLAGVQERAYAFVRDAIDRGLPCYGWELDIPEFFVIYGYDDLGYYFSGPGCDDGKGPKPWRELGDTDIGMVEVYSVQPGQAADDVTVVHSALEAALRHSQNPDEWILPHYRAGLAGFDNWIRSVEAGTASAMGMSYNAAVWEECRRQGAAFLREARDRVGRGIEELFDQAMVHYQAVARQLKAVVDLYPFTLQEGRIQIDDASREAVVALKAAREAEAAGLQGLAAIVSGLGGP